MQVVPDNLFDSVQTEKCRSFSHIDKEAQEFLTSVCFIVNVNMGRNPFFAKKEARKVFADTRKDVSKAA